MWSICYNWWLNIDTLLLIKVHNLHEGGTIVASLRTTLRDLSIAHLQINAFLASLLWLYPSPPPSWGYLWKYTSQCFSVTGHLLWQAFPLACRASFCLANRKLTHPCHTNSSLVVPSNLTHLGGSSNSFLPVDFGRH